jgi:hypothetical protein
MEANGTSDQILDCQWVIMNTASKHGKLLRHKARPETLGNQQHDCGLPTRATALAMTLPRVLSAMVANFDLHTLQTYSLNALVHTDLDELVPQQEEVVEVVNKRKIVHTQPLNDKAASPRGQ